MKCENTARNLLLLHLQTGRIQRDQRHGAGQRDLQREHAGVQERDQDYEVRCKLAGRVFDPFWCLIHIIADFTQLQPAVFAAVWFGEGGAEDLANLISIINLIC